MVLVLTQGPSFATERVETWRLDSRFAAIDPISTVKDQYPNLRDHAEAISHFAGYYRVNLFLLAEAVELRHAAPDQVTIDTVKDLAQAIGDALEIHSAKIENDDEGPFATELEATLSWDKASALRLLKNASKSMTENGISSQPKTTTDFPPALDLPFDHDAKWRFSAAHHCSGSRLAYPMSSLDFGAPGAQFGDDTSGDWVAAAHDGTITVYSRCFVQVTHPSGWQTNYYHVADIQYETGDQVLAGTHISVNANNQADALCQGGASTYPHTHFDLLNNGQCASLENVYLSGYLVHPGRFSFDDSPTHMWIEKRGIRYFAFGNSIGHESGDNVIDYRYNGMWSSAEIEGHGLNISIAQVKDQNDDIRNVLFVALFTYDDNGDATFYVGNVDFARWRSDEAMVLDMIQTRGGNFTNLQPIDPAFDITPAGTLSVLFLSCTEAQINFVLNERSSDATVEQTFTVFKFGADTDQVCSHPSVQSAQ